MKKVFKKAHEMTRKFVEEYGVDYQAQFGLCLSYLLEKEREEEEVKELKGTPKQIAWAEKIREEQLESFYRFKEKWIEKRKAEGNQKELDYIEELTRKIENLDQASDWIEIHQRRVVLHRLLVPKRRENEMKYLEGIL